MPVESLPRDRIIRRRSTFDATRLQGRRLNNRWMTLSLLARDPANPDPASVAFLTPTRLGPATVRNRLRRRMREIYRRHLQGENETRYLVWIARPPAVALAFEELQECMTALRARST
jgi:ribonuclease P protein component